MIILIGGEKGGTGKTTIATNFAAMRVLNNRDVLFIDTDAQASASNWCELREHEEVPRISCIQKFGASLTVEIKHLAEKYEDVIIDAGGRNSIELRASMAAADVLCIPIQASQFDVWTIASMNALVASSRAFNPNLRAYVILNRASTNSGVSEAGEAAEFLSEFEELRLAKAVLKDRIAYRKAARAGLSLVEMEQDDKAIQEIKALYDDIFEVW